MTKLNQIIALEKGVKAETDRVLNGVYHLFQKPDAFAGLTKTYTSLEEDGFVYPPENRKVTASVPTLLSAAQAAWERLFDLTFTKDATNQEASADIVVNGTVLVEAVPVSTLIWLEKKLVDLRTVMSKVPVTDIAEDWTWDAEQGVWKAAPVRTLRSKKVEDYVVIVPPTDKHPAQTAKVVRDEPEGHWTTTKLSGATSVTSRDAALARITVLTEAVKRAREQANMAEVTDRSMGNVLLNFVFGG